MFRTSHNYVGLGLLSGTMLAAIISIGCGGGMQSSSTSSSNTPAATNPSSSAPGSGSSGGTTSGGSGSSGSSGSGSSGSGGSGGSGSGGSGGSGGGGGTTSYFFAALLSTNDSSNHGQITLNTTGGGTVQLQGATAGTTFSVEFCQFPNGTSNCFSVGSGSVTTDSSGNAQSSFTFSRSGNWAGIFLLQPSGGGTGYDSDFPVPGSGTSQYQNPLLQAGTITGGTPSFWGPDGTDPLTSGFVTITGNIAHFTLTGALPNSSYTVNFCGNGGGSSCFADLGTVTTDASGNGAADIDTMGRNIPGVFGLARSDGALQFITGVHVP